MESLQYGIMIVNHVLSQLKEHCPGCVIWVGSRAIGWVLLIGYMIGVEAQEGGANKLRPNAEKIGQFFERHCQKCHSGVEHEGDFQISRMSPNFDEENNRDRWLAVLEQLEAGEMPPKKEPRPGVDEFREVIDWIRDRAYAAERIQRAEEGRVVLRRLNRAEYVNTLRDLLHIEVDFTDLLPPDTSTSGFDNNAAALHTSSYLLRNYLDAADRALNAAIANTRKPWRLDKVFDIREEKSVSPTGSVYRHTDDGVAIFASWESANIRVTMWNFRSHVRGKYRFRISGYGYQSDSKPVDFHVTAGTLKEVTEERLIDYYSLPADKPTVVEFTEQLEPENRIRIIADGLPALPPEVERVGADQYKGPGLVIQWVEIVGPLLESWPPPSHRSIFGEMRQEKIENATEGHRNEVVSEQPELDAERILRNFARRAFRRTVTDKDIQPFLTRVKKRLNEGYSFEQAVRVGLKSILISPKFLFLLETPTLDDFALASRLSYFLWSSMPDSELLELAESGKLKESDVLHQQIDRMLNDPKARAFTENFTGQWLSLRAIDATAPDRTLYPEYDDILRSALLKEPMLFFEEVLKHDLSLTHFVSSNFTYLNARLAEHYGIPDVEGAEMRKVMLPSESHRGGFLTMAGVLKVTANGTTTSPVLRGAWTLDRILGMPPKPPPPDIGTIEPDIRGATTIRDQLAKHRAAATCARCHNEIDPPGFALESFDVIGGWRDHYRSMGDGSRRVVNGRGMRYWPGSPVDSSDVLSDGRAFQNIDAYKQLLLEDKDQLARSLTVKLLAYATGAPPSMVDQEEIETIVGHIRDKNYGFRSLIHAITQSDMFQSK